MFNFNHDQNAANPNPNNYCGGYSLAAIVSKLQPHEDNDPIHVYTALLSFQNRNLNRLFRNTPNDPSPNAQTLINGAQLQGSGTNMLLPSTFLAAQYAQLNYELNMNQGTFVQQALFPNNINLNNIIAEERTTINNLGANLNQLIAGINLQIFLNNDAVANNHQYWLVLVLGGRHWVAIERDPNNGQYCIYNPAGGINDNVIIANNQIRYNNGGHVPHDWTGIAISVA